MGMCYGYATNLMYRLNNETTAKAWIMLVTGIGDPQPDMPYSEGKVKRHIRPVHETPMSYLWGHAAVLFLTVDNRLYIVDENTCRPVELDMDVFWHNIHQEHNADGTFNTYEDDFADWALKTLWKKAWKGKDEKGDKYPIDTTHFRVSFSYWKYGKRDIMDDIDESAENYFVGQDHAYYFPPDWCVD